MKTRSVTITTQFIAEVPANMTDDEIQDIGIELDVSKVKARTFAATIRGAKVLSYETTTIEPNE